MQRKLSEIAEIPRILSSTLATVSQTFDKLMPEAVSDRYGIHELVQQNRKFSYDEDAIDYELNDGGESDNEYEKDYDNNSIKPHSNEDSDRDNDDYNDDEDGDKDEHDSEKDYDHVYNDDEEEVVYTFCQKLHKLTLRAVKKLRELTPESDYASSDSDDDVNDNDNNDDDDDDGAGDYESTTNVSGDYSYNNKKNVNDEDFLTTSFTWRLRKLPKMCLNEDEPNDNSSDNRNDEENDEEYNGKEQKHEHNDKDIEQTTSVQNCNQKTISIQRDATGQDSQKQEKISPLERAWPWADRTKIIYKQSSCHLVPPRKPLGIIEKSKQLLAKQNLFDKIQRAQQTN